MPERLTRTGPRTRRRGLVLAGLVAAVLVVIAAVPALRARAKAVPVLARSAGLPFPRPLARRVAVVHIHGGGLDGDLYRPDGSTPAVVLAPGGAPEGKDDPRIVRVARSLAGAGRAVFVPQLEIRHQRLVWSDVEMVVRSVRALRATGETVGCLGFSFGGTFCLLAAEDPRIASGMAFVAVFGAYDDLLDVVQGVTTGATTLDRAVVPWKTVPEARRILTRAAVGLQSPPDRGPLAAALAARDPSGLSPGARAMYAVLTNTDPRKTFGLAANLPPAVRAIFDRFSPGTRIHELRAPLYIMQSEDDPAGPPTEALRLHRSVPGSRLVMLRYFQHVNPPGAGTPLGGYIADAWGAWEFTSWVLAAQE